ncbi:MAG: ADP-ribosylglycohydrolase family protein [Oribacterium sp.]|nr:ADP-ribosylglycohydrolase family protein [Oribacterium sp.]
MYGAIIGDMVGAPYEFDRSPKIKDFGPLFIQESCYTDDSMMTIAIADAIMTVGSDADEQTVKSQFVTSMQKWGRKYPDAGYGGMFYNWLYESNPQPYGSYGNGSAMRVSSVGWLFDSLEKTREVARWSAEVTHNDPEGIKGAEATATAIYMARTGKSKDEIRDYIISEFGYDLSQTCGDIRPWYKFDVTCQGTIPVATIAFYEGKDFEDVIRTAVSLGGDCDTLTCIAGGMAEAFYGVPDELQRMCDERLPDDALNVVHSFRATVNSIKS